MRGKLFELSTWVRHRIGYFSASKDFWISEWTKNNLNKRDCLGIKPHIWVIDQAWGQDGWILAKFFFLRVYVHNFTKKVNVKKQRRFDRSTVIFKLKA